MRLRNTLGTRGTVLLAVCAVGLGWWLLREGKLSRLIRGDTEVELVSLTLECGWVSEKIELNDPESVRYLTAAFRSAVHDGYVPTYSGKELRAELTFGRFDWSHTDVRIPKEADGITLTIHKDFDDPHYYWIAFPKPMPPRVAAALERMRKW